MDVVEIVDPAQIAVLEKLRADKAFVRTPNVEEVVYISYGFAEKTIVRGTIQTDGRWKYETVPSIGY